MIGALNGKILNLKPTSLILMAGGTGYEVNISINTYDRILNSTETFLYIHTSVKEDAITLYGFYTEEEREMFRLLISISGIGPKTAQSVLSKIRPDELRIAIGAGDVKRISATPGIGKKTAERLILELRSKVEFSASESGTTISGNIRGEAILALQALGYNLKTATDAVNTILKTMPEITLENLIKAALKMMN
ncbi:MAG: Holliday junction branch migration protein RuvA [Ignavibacteriaceae bacterium]|nr:Holliday junction branch migration protein RuvA [Ignavibacteriaceae bacterium]NUM70391.1 Holliday junction branch migration protein RuvA [Ignavibacteriaceae bacterium]